MRVRVPLPLYIIELLLFGLTDIVKVNMIKPNRGVQMECEKCGKEHDGTYGSGRFCCRGCANSRVQTKEMNEARRKKLTKNEQKFCKVCGKKLNRHTKSELCIKHHYNNRKNPAGLYSRKVKKFCMVCGVEICRGNKSGFCQKHFGIQTKTINERKRKEKIDKWLKEGVIDTMNPRDAIRDYILTEQSNCCAVCGMKDEWNRKKIVFVLDHISGDNRNHSRENLRMVCPNCDSQLPTFKSKNKGNGREYDREYRKKRYAEKINNKQF